MRSGMVGFLGAQTPSGGDPHWVNVISLLHFDDPIGSSNFTDEVQLAWGRNGSATTTDADSAFGGISGYCNGGTDRFWSQGNAMWALGTGDFTIEGWLRPINNGLGDAYGRVFQIGENAKYGGLYMAHVGSTAPPQVMVTGYDGGYRDLLPTPVTIPNDVWSHLAVTRESGVWRVFVGGELAVSQDNNGALGNDITPTGLGAMLGGNNVSTENFRAYFDEWRVTKGVCRYTENFTPPTGPFPNY